MGKVGSDFAICFVVTCKLEAFILVYSFWVYAIMTIYCYNFVGKVFFSHIMFSIDMYFLDSVLHSRIFVVTSVCLP